MMLTRRALLISAALGVPTSIDAKNKRKKRKHRKPAPYALAHYWSVDAAPRTILVQCGAGPDWIGPVRAAVETWNNAQPWLRLDVQEIAPPAEDTMPDPGTILVMAANRDAWWGGISEVVPGEHGIAGARITFDDADYAGRYPWPKSKARQLIAAHELGHALGLPHAPSRDKGCMAPDPRHHPAAHPSAWTLRQLALTYGS